MHKIRRYFIEAKTGYFECSADADEDRETFMNGFAATLANIADLERAGAVAFPPPKTEPIYTPRFESHIKGVYNDRPFKVAVDDPRIKPGYEGWPTLATKIQVNSKGGLDFINAEHEFPIFFAPRWVVCDVMSLDDNTPLDALDWDGHWVFTWRVGEGQYDAETDAGVVRRYYNDLTGLWRVEDYIAQKGTALDLAEPADPADPPPAAEPPPATNGNGHAPPNGNGNGSDLATARVRYVADQVGPAVADGVPIAVIPDANSLVNLDEVDAVYTYIADQVRPAVAEGIRANDLPKANTLTSIEKVRAAYIKVRKLRRELGRQPA